MLYIQYPKMLKSKNISVTFKLKTVSLLLLSSCFFTFTSFCQTKYYINSLTGNDSNNGTSASTPWKTINKVNAMWNVFVAGDSVLFNKADIFYGSLSISGRNGTAINPIVFSAYGTGNMPIIRASQQITGWTIQSGNIWKATLPKLSKQVWNGTAFVPYYFRTPSLFIGNVSQRLGREPDYNTTDGGFRRINTHTGDNLTITEAAALPYATNRFQSAEITIRTNREYYKTEKVASHSGNNVVVTSTNSNSAVNTILDQYGYFFQNHINTLNLDGEWCHDTTTSTIYLYSTVDPNSRNIEAPLNPSTLVINNCSYVNVVALQFENASDNTVAGQNDDNISISNCYINNSNLYGSYIYLVTNSSFLNNTFINSNNSGLRLELCSGMTVSGNTVKNTGMYAGMSEQGTISCIGIRVMTNTSGNNSIIEKNLVDSTGYLGVNMGGYGLFVRQNEIRNFCLIKDDGGGIYSATNTAITKIYQNFVHDAQGAPFGAPAGSQVKSAGIYSDNGSQNQEVYNNTIYNIGYWGIMVNLSGNNSYHDNTIFNCSGTSMILNTYNNNLGPGGTAYTALNNNVKRNIFFPRTSTQRCADYINTYNPADLTSNLGTLDSNYYCQPYSGGSVIRVQGGSTNNYTLAQFKTNYPAYESHGKPASFVLNPGDNPATFLRLETNSTASPFNVNFGGSSYIDALGNIYTGLTSIPAYGSLALIRTSALLPLKLLDFDAQAVDHAVLLTWATTNEIGTANFEIERSNDGISFQKIGTIIAKAGGTENKYDFTDKFCEVDNYYRLKMIDVDGRFYYSSVEHIRFAGNKTQSNIQVSPNPVNDGNLYFHFTSESKGPAKIMLTNISGQQLSTKNITIVSGNNNIKFDVKNISKGLYYVTIITGDNKPVFQPQKIIIE
jgi:hypothetical protein